MQKNNAQLQDQNTLLRAQLSTGTSMNETLLLRDSNDLDVHLNSHDTDMKKLELDNKEKDDELERLRKDQEDLLELLTDQDLKLNAFKNRLRDLGETVDDADSDNNSVCSDIGIET